MAVDINTLFNPYHKIVTNEDGSQEEVIEPATGKPYLDREQNFDYKIRKGLITIYDNLYSVHNRFNIFILSLLYYPIIKVIYSPNEVRMRFAKQNQYF